MGAEALSGSGGSRPRGKPPSAPPPGPVLPGPGPGLIPGLRDPGRRGQPARGAPATRRSSSRAATRWWSRCGPACPRRCCTSARGSSTTRGSARLSSWPPTAAWSYWRRGAPHRAGAAELDRLTGGALHQGLALKVRPYNYAHPDDLLARAVDAAQPPLIVAL